MDQNWVLQQIRKASLHRLIWWGGLLACALLFVVAQHRYAINFFQGPFTLTKAELDAIGDASTAPRYFARVTASKVIDTGIRQITIRKRRGVESSRSESGQFHVLVLEDRLLVVRNSGGAQATAEGQLVPLQGELEARLFGTPDMQSIKQRFYPFYVDDDSFRLPGYIAIGVILALAFLAFRFGAAPLQHYLKPSTHPVAARVASWGDTARIAAQAAEESRAPLAKSRGWLVTPTYLVRMAHFTFDLHRLADLQWAYKRVTTSNMVKMHSAVLMLNGAPRGIEIQGPEKITDGVLNSAATRVPWAVFGYSPEIEQHFNQNRQGFAATIVQRRADWAQRQTGAAA